jgi:DHA3 family tetracycline resistance protein-like MFS transporter
MTFFEKGELKLLWPFYLEVLLSTLLFIYPAFWILYFKEINLTLIQIGFLVSAISVSTLLFEIPTGAIADIYGRKFSVVLGYFLSGLALIAMYFVRSFYGLLVIWFLWGIFNTFTSGARESWIADYLKYYKKDRILRDYFMKEHSFSSFAIAIAGLVGTVFVKYFGLGIIWPVTGFSLLISAGILFFIPEKGKPKAQKSYNILGIFTQAHKSIKYSLKHSVILLLLAATFFGNLWACFGGPGVGDLLWQPFLKNLGLPVYLFGTIFFGIIIIGTISPYIAKFILTKISREENFFALAYLMQMLFILAILFASSWVVGAVLIFMIFFFTDLASPVKNSFFQKFIPSEMRATITNLNGVVISVSTMIGAPLAGFIADKIGPQYAMVVGGLFLIPAAFVYLSIKKKNK